MEDVGTQKYALRKFQLTKDKNVSSQIHNYYLLINDLANEEVKLPEPFMVGYLIETLPNSQKDYKNI